MPHSQVWMHVVEVKIWLGYGQDLERVTIVVLVHVVKVGDPKEDPWLLVGRNITTYLINNTPVSETVSTVGGDLNHSKGRPVSTSRRQKKLSIDRKDRMERIINLLELISLTGTWQILLCLVGISVGVKTWDVSEAVNERVTQVFDIFMIEGVIGRKIFLVTVQTKDEVYHRESSFVFLVGVHH